MLEPRPPQHQPQAARGQEAQQDPRRQHPERIKSIQWMVQQQEEECLCGEGLPVHLLHRAEGGEEAADLPRPPKGTRKQTRALII